MKIKTKSWQKNDYLAFLLLYMSRTDLEVHKEDLEFIANEVGEEKMHEVEPLLDECNDYQCLEVITVLREQYFPGKEGKEELMDELRQLCNADGQYTQMEHAVTNSLDRLL